MLSTSFPSFVIPSGLIETCFAKEAINLPDARGDRDIFQLELESGL